MKKTFLLIWISFFGSIVFGQSSSTESSGKQSSLPFGYIQSGYQNITEVGILAGTGLIHSGSFRGNYQNDAMDFSLSTVNGWLICPYVFSGIGVAIEKEKNDYRLPFYIDTRFFILKRTVTPFIYTEMGYALGWMKGEGSCDWGGIMLSLGPGILFHFTKSNSLLISLGYKIQEIKLNASDYLFDHSTEISYANYIAIKIGCSF
jgi:hypothetical protein